MSKKINRRKFIVYGSAALGVSSLIKACTPATPTATTTTAATTSASPTATATAAAKGGTIKVGILHSLSGTMAISEKSLVDATQLAIEEINKAGGVLGKQIEAIVEDGNSDWPTFAEKAKKLIDQDKVVVVFGCWTSASRKAVLPVFEAKDHLLFYPVQYEGQDSKTRAKSSSSLVLTMYSLVLLTPSSRHNWKLWAVRSLVKTIYLWATPKLRQSSPRLSKHFPMVA